MASIYENERGNSILIIGGVKMTLNEYKKMKADEKKAKEKEANKGKKRKVKKNTDVKELSEVAKEINSLLTPLTVLKSIYVYKNHAYRSWGTIANDILNLREIRVPMVAYCVKYSEAMKLFGDIEKMAKRNEKDIFQFVEKLSWKLDDMKQDITTLSQGVNRSGVCQQFKTHECINGKGRQLGLQTVIRKCYKAMDKIEETIKRLKEIADDGIDIMEYDRHLSYKQRRRVL